MTYIIKKPYIWRFCLSLMLIAICLIAKSSFNSTIVTAQTPPDITITKQALSSEIIQHPTDSGHELTYEIVIQNGTITYNGPMTLTDIVPQGALCIDTRTIAGPTFNWSENDALCQRFNQVEFVLEAGEQLIANEMIRLQYTVIASTTNASITNFDNDIVLTGNNLSADVTGSNDVTTPVRRPLWSINKTATPPNGVAPGGQIVYAITVANTGNYQTGRPFQIVEQIPANTTLINSGGGIINGDTITWNFTDILNPAETRTVSFIVEVDNSGLNNGDEIINNSYSVVGGYVANTPVVGSPVTVPIDAPVTVRVAKNGPATVNAGQNITYIITLENDPASQSSVTGLFLADTIPDNTTYVDHGFNNGQKPEDLFYFDGLVAVWDLRGTRNIGEVTELYLTVQVAPTTPGNTIISNDAYQLYLLNPPPNYRTDPPQPFPSVDTTVVGAAQLNISKSAPVGIVRPGDLIVYTIDINNLSNQTNATNVQVTEVVPLNSTFVAGSSTPAWSCADGAGAGTACQANLGTIAASGSTQAIFAVRVNPFVNPQQAEINNTATLDYNSANGIPVTIPDPAEFGPILIDVPGVLIEPDQERYAEPGVTVTYPLTVTNTGNSADIMTFTVTAGSFPATLNVPSLALGPFQSGIIYLEVMIPTTATVLSADTTGVTAFSTNASTVNDIAILETIVTNAPDLAVSKQANVALIRPGDTLNYSISAINQSGVTAQGVVITETLPQFTTFVPNQYAWQFVGNNQYRLIVGNLPAFITQTVEFQVQIDDSAPLNTQLLNRVEIADNGASGSDPNLANNSDTSTVTVSNQTSGGGQLWLFKSDNGMIPRPGEQIIYNLSYANFGNTVASGVIITETVPAYTTADLTASLPTVWQCPNGTTAGEICTHAVGDLTASTMGPTTTFVVRLNNAIPANVTQINNTATIADSARTSRYTDSATTQINNTGVPNLIINKTDLGITASLNEIIVYTLDYENNGNGIATGVLIQEIVPQHTTFDAANSSVGWDCMDGDSAGVVCTYAVDSLASNSGSQQITFAVRVNSSVPENYISVGNIVTIQDSLGNTSVDTEDTPLENTPPSETYHTFLPIVLKMPPPEPSLDLIVWDVIASNQTPQVGEPVTFEVTIKNQGPANVTDPFWVDLYLATTPISPQPGQSWDSYNIDTVPYGVVWKVYGISASDTQRLSNLAPNDPRNLRDNYSNFIPNGLGQWEQTWCNLSLNNYFHTAGTYYLYAQVDSLNNIAENNSQNNVYGPIEITVTGSSLPFNPQCPTTTALDITIDRPTVTP